MSEKKFIDPNTITDFPVVVLVDDLRGFVGWGIKTHTKGNYNHVMTLYRPGYCASQGFWMYADVPLKKYLRPGIMLKFWALKGCSAEIKRQIIDKNTADLKLPWWRRGYDYLGILGQATGIKWVQTPWKHFCSEAVAEDLRLDPKLREVIPERPSPADLDRIFEAHPEYFECAGYWIGE